MLILDFHILEPLEKLISVASYSHLRINGHWMNILFNRDLYCMIYSGLYFYCFAYMAPVGT